MASRKCVISTYTFSTKFKIPKGIDLDNKDQVKSWGVKYARLYIYLTNGEELTIEDSYGIEDYDFKWSEKDEIEEDDSDSDED
jgi:hypothetical protein